MPRPGLTLALPILLGSLQTQCLLIARGGRELDLLWFLAGVLLLFLGLRILMSSDERAHFPPWKRFLVAALMAALTLIG